jgi:hypothetical protein
MQIELRLRFAMAKKSSLSAEQKRHVLDIAAKVDGDEKAAQDERARAESDQGDAP